MIHTKNMKKTMTMALLLLGAQMTNARIWRVNNTVGVTADFTQPSGAIAAAAPGDTIHIEGSATGYSAINMNKRLVIRGAGYFLADATPNPKTQHNKNGSYVSTVTIGSGSKGSVIEGLTADYFHINDSLVTVQRNYVGSGLYAGNGQQVHGDTIRNNYIDAGINNSANFKATGLFIYNNIIRTSLNFGIVANVDGYCINNTFTGLGYSFACANFVFQNNIFNGANFGAYLPSNIFYNNMTSNTGLPNTNNNVLSVNLNNVFEGWASSTGFSSDGRYKLKAGSPALNAGILNGSPVDCGAFGGPAPYVLSGMPPMPSIYNITMPAQVNAGTSSISITVSAAAH